MTHRTVTEVPLSSTVEFGTGLLRTRVVTLSPALFEWNRTLGELAPDPFVVPRPRLASLVDGLPAGNGGVRLLTGEGDGAARRYRAPGRESLANRLLREGPEPVTTAVLRGLGEVLRTLHDTGLPPEAPEQNPRGLSRLRSWLTADAGIGYSASARGLLRDQLGEERWDRLGAWCSELWDGPGRVLSHGAPNLGSVVVDHRGDGVALLTGEDLSAAPRNFDVGWLLGELVEVRWQLGGDNAGWQQMVNAFLEGYGNGAVENWHRLAALRIALHLHDFTAYVGGSPEEVRHYGGFLTFLIDLEGRDT